MTDPQNAHLVLNESYPIQTRAGRYLLVVPTSAFLALDEVTGAIADLLVDGDSLTAGEIIDSLDHRFTAERVDAAIGELLRLETLRATQQVAGAAARVDGPSGVIGRRSQRPPTTLELDTVPVTGLTAHIAHDCNLRCTYCYADTGPYNGERAQMTCTMARQYVDLLIERSGDAHRVALQFFGGEPLMNYPTLVDAIHYGTQRGREVGKDIRFAVTTNGTLLDQEKFEFLASHQVGITVSMDGPPDVHDRFRIFADGQGSYSMIARRLPPLLRTYPVHCRVTLTRKTLDAPKLVDHFLQLGFHEVMIGTVASPDPLLALASDELPSLLDGFRECAARYVHAAVQGKLYGFGNLSNMLRLIHEGHARSFGCGAGIQTFAGDPDGNLYTCHRLVGNSKYKVGELQSGIDRAARAASLGGVQMGRKLACQTCWARHLCAGGCFYQLEMQFGDTTRTYEPLCDWIRGWLTTCLEAYAIIMDQRPEFIEQVIEPRLQ